jgi:PBSX family phage terminase large subunit
MAELIDLIAPSFYPVHNLIKEKKYTHFWEKGGRGSTKSSFISLEFILDIINNPEKHGIALRKYAANLQDSVFTQLLWAIDQLELTNYFKYTLSPLRIKYYTGQQIYFRGCDDATKIKSIKPKFGYIGTGWFEELNEFKDMAEVRNVRQSFVRGGDDFKVFYSYNPPKESNNWVNKESISTKVITEDGEEEEKHVHHSTYLEVPPEWLGKQFIKEANLLKLSKFQDYEHEYLGIPNGAGETKIVKYWSEENIKKVNYLPELDLHITCDFNLSPNCWILAHKTDQKVYFFDEFCLDLATEDLIKVILDKYPHPGKIIINGDAAGDYGLG